MNGRKVSVRISCLGMLIVLTFSMLLVACEPAPPITFDNQQNQEVRIFVAHVRDDGTIGKFSERGTVHAHATQTFGITFFGDEWIKRIEIRDSSGNVVLSYDYKMSDLEKIDWEIVIPP